ncbi:MAG TPA: GDSL-type esterase/lipase family protein [Lichenihabitans sp.]|nr:GDSL-type esterase/lipase family protein [Lichenihabitans sp.]
MLGLWLWPAGTAAWAAQGPATVRPDDPRPGSGPKTAAFRIIALGSSSTQGVGATSPAATYPAQLERLLNEAYRAKLAISVVNRGIGGEDINDMMKRLKADVLFRKPDLVIWQVGSNDPLRGVPLDRFKTELRDGIDEIQATGAEVVLMEPQWCPAIAKVDGANRFVEAVRDVGAAEHVDVVRRFDLMHQWITEGFASRRGLVGPDGLHMTDQGYAMLAKAVFDEISARSVAFHDGMARTVSTRH